VRILFAEMLNDAIGKDRVKAVIGQRKKPRISNHKLGCGTQLPANPARRENCAQRWVNANHTIAQAGGSYRPPSPVAPNIKQAPTLHWTQS